MPCVGLGLHLKLLLIYVTAAYLDDIATHDIPPGDGDQLPTPHDLHRPSVELQMQQHNARDCCSIISESI